MDPTMPGEAQRKTDKTGFVQVQGIHKMGQEVNVVVQGVLDCRFVALPVAWQVGSKNPLVCRQGADTRSPGNSGRVQSPTVQEYHWGTALTGNKTMYTQPIYFEPRIFYCCLQHGLRFSF